MDSDASVMEGNDIEDLGGGSFRTIAAAERYSRLDLYGMGLVGPATCRRCSTSTRRSTSRPAAIANRRRGSASPSTAPGATVLIQDIVDALGARQPAVDSSPKLHRQAWVYVIGRGTTPSQADLTRLDRMRREFEPYFRRITENRMTVTTSLR